MKVYIYKGGEFLGYCAEISIVKYETEVITAMTTTGAVKAGDWMSDAALEKFGITRDTVVYFEAQ